MAKLRNRFLERELIFPIGFFVIFLFKISTSSSFHSSKTSTLDLDVRGFNDWAVTDASVTAGELRGGAGAAEEAKEEPQEKGLEVVAAFEEEESEKNEKRRDCKVLLAHDGEAKPYKGEQLPPILAFVKWLPSPSRSLIGLEHAKVRSIPIYFVTLPSLGQLERIRILAFKRFRFASLQRGGSMRVAAQ
ncbi:hypothetical protein WN944_014973 [Citrus x changshan-huyou]|uniref:Uncharacterized protein n=1 Tax=Citrus x changshan-huyou TaxID=2935761 RepID=A0AAP0MBL4_9ROSI